MGTQDSRVLEWPGQLSGKSAQVAELHSVPDIAMAGCDVNIYPDSRHTFEVEHHYVTRWVNSEFLTSTVSPIQNE